jgi:hypothetical protein
MSDTDPFAQLVPPRPGAKRESDIWRWLAQALRRAPVPGQWHVTRVEAHLPAGWPDTWWLDVPTGVVSAVELKRVGVLGTAWPTWAQLPWSSRAQPQWWATWPGRGGVLAVASGTRDEWRWYPNPRALSDPARADAAHGLPLEPSTYVLDPTQHPGRWLTALAAHVLRPVGT